MTIDIKPAALGAAMGLMMIWMVHMQMAGTTTLSLTALALFVGAHVAVLGATLIVLLFGAKLHPRLRGWMERVHRPDPKHIATMAVSAAFSAGIAHLWFHGIGG